MHLRIATLLWAVVLALGWLSSPKSWAKDDCATLVVHDLAVSSEHAALDAARIRERVSLSAQLRGRTSADRVFDAHGDIGRYLPQILLEYRLHGGLHITNTGLAGKNDLLAQMPGLGFEPSRSFVSGGRVSDHVQDHWFETNVLRRLDYYPPQLFLPPNTEIQYKKFSPRDILFYVDSPGRAEDGGTIYLHAAHDIDEAIKAQNGGPELLSLVHKYGMLIVAGYPDAKRLGGDFNYMKSWQELSGKENLDEAIAELESRRGDFDHVWARKDENNQTFTLMTEIKIQGYRTENGVSHLNIPRIALTEPSLLNGYREFLLGNGAKLSEEQNQILLHAFIQTRVGSRGQTGDVYLFDNLRVAHSRDSFDPSGSRQVMVAMSGTRWAEDFSQAGRDTAYRENQMTAGHFQPLWQQPNVAAGGALPRAFDPEKNGGVRYWTPPIAQQMSERFSMVTYDAAGKDLNDPKVLAEIRAEFEKYGHLHVIHNNQYTQELPEHVLKGLGYGKDEQFAWGGSKSGRTVRASLGGGFHTVDKFPADMPLLAHNEILYQRVLPRRLLFHYRQVSGDGRGGRTFVHSAELSERMMAESGAVGRELLAKLRKYGQMIRTGFLDENHSEKEKNFVRSWQDRFGTKDIDQAVRNCQEQQTHFDKCWKAAVADPAGGPTRYMLMTEITIPMFKKDERNGHSYMMFPRIAYDGPSLINGMRQFVIGNGEEFTPEEREVMIRAFWLTREGIYQSPGDIMLVDNLRYGHSREPYLEVDENGKPLVRKAGIVMAGEFYTDDLAGRQMQSESAKSGE